jgi:hypothetical protein
VYRIYAVNFYDASAGKAQKETNIEGDNNEEINKSRQSANRPIVAK